MEKIFLKTNYTPTERPFYRNNFALMIRCASHCFPIFNILFDWRSSYHLHKILSTCLLDRKTMWGTPYINDNFFDCIDLKMVWPTIWRFTKDWRVAHSVVKFNRRYKIGLALLIPTFATNSDCFKIAYLICFLNFVPWKNLYSHSNVETFSFWMNVYSVHKFGRNSSYRS